MTLEPITAAPLLETAEEPGEDGKGPDLEVDGKEEPTVGPNVIDTVSSQSVIFDKLKSDDPVEPSPVPSEPPVEPSLVPSEPPSPLTSSRSSPRRILTMPGLADLSDLILHSPSSQIVGTPYATNSTRFEYPFPDSSSTHSSSSPPSSSTLNNIQPPPLASGSSFPAISTSTSSSLIFSPTLSYPMSSSDTPSYNTAHPKLKTQANPPIPPSLAKRRTGWSLNRFGRRKSSSAGSQSSMASGTTDASLSAIDGILSGSQVTNPLGSPREERGKH